MRTCNCQTGASSRPVGRPRRQWRDYTPAQRTGLVVLGAIEVGLAVAAWTDLVRRDQREVRGRKWVWALVIAINVVGPLAYCRWGRQAEAGDNPSGSSVEVAPEQREVS